MPRPSLAQQGSEALSLSDFELVRNAKGEWLLIVSQAPATFIDNPLQSLCASIDGSTLVIQSASAKLIIQTILSNEYIAAMQSDAPAHIFFSVVDDDGSRQFSAQIPMQWTQQS